MVIFSANYVKYTTCNYNQRLWPRLTGPRAFDQCPAPFAGGYPIQLADRSNDPN